MGGVSKARHMLICTVSNRKKQLESVLKVQSPKALSKPYRTLTWNSLPSLSETVSI